jgi:regulation of enolase protein 1 (concanavalin A-like superfamily)
MSRSRLAPDSHSEHLFQLVLRYVSQNTNYMPNMRLSEIGTVSDLGTITIYSKQQSVVMRVNRLKPDMRVKLLIQFETHRR